MMVSETHKLQFRAFVEHVAQIQDEDWLQIEPLLSTVSYRQGELILKPGEVCRKMLFLVDGMARSYLLDVNGREFNWSLHFNDNVARPTNVFVIDYASFISRRPSRLNIEAVTDCTALVITYDDLNHLYYRSHVWSNIGRVIAEQVYQLTHNRALNQLSLGAKERYQQFLTTNPHLVEKLTQNQLAAFLGITPQSLSRLKNR